MYSDRSYHVPPLDVEIPAANDLGNATCDSAAPITQAASSFHPGGANFAFADGSVHFLKDTLSTWNAYTLTRDANRLPVVNPSVSGGMAGVYPALATRAGGEVISADQY